MASQVSNVNPGGAQMTNAAVANTGNNQMQVIPQTVLQTSGPRFGQAFHQQHHQQRPQQQRPLLQSTQRTHNPVPTSNVPQGVHQAVPQNMSHQTHQHYVVAPTNFQTQIQFQNQIFNAHNMTHAVNDVISQTPVHQYFNCFLLLTFSRIPIRTDQCRHRRITPYSRLNSNLLQRLNQRTLLMLVCILLIIQFNVMSMCRIVYRPHHYQPHAQTPTQMMPSQMHQNRGPPVSSQAVIQASQPQIVQVTAPTPNEVTKSIPMPSKPVAPRKKQLTILTDPNCGNTLNIEELYGMSDKYFIDYSN